MVVVFVDMLLMNKVLVIICPAEIVFVIILLVNNVFINKDVVDKKVVLKESVINAALEATSCPVEITVVLRPPIVAFPDPWPPTSKPPVEISVAFSVCALKNPEARTNPVDIFSAFTVESVADVAYTLEAVTNSVGTVRKVPAAATRVPVDRFSVLVAPTVAVPP